MSWFANWFDTKYYHQLYQYRDEVEAAKLVNKIAQLFPSNKHPFLCDAACGKGRHAQSFADLGYQVDAFDLSANSISIAKAMEKEGLNYFLHDILEPLNYNKYDIVTNLFTSFGYFNEQDKDIQALSALAKSLKPNGIFIQDYLNTSLVKADEMEIEKELKGVLFKSKKQILDNKVYKDITVIDGKNTYQFQEKVTLYKKENFEKMYAQAGLKLILVFGDYNLNTFDVQTSPRLLMISQKIG